MTNKVEVFGFGVDIVTPEEAGRRVVDLTQEPGVHQVITLNSEQVVAGADDQRFCEAVRGAALVTADSAGVAMAASLEAGRSVPRVTGMDLLCESARRFAQDGTRIFILGGLPGVAEEALAALQNEVKEKYGGYVLKGQAMSGPEKIYALTPKDHEYQEISQKVVDSGAGLLACALSSPEGVFWLGELLNYIEQNYKLDHGLAGAVFGGVINRLAGRVPNAPKVLKDCGLEWLYRLYREPSRLPRIFNAVVKFPLMYLKWRFSKKL